MVWQDRLDEIRERTELARAGGEPDRIERQHARGRQRIAQLHMSLLGLYGNLWDEHREEGQHGAAAQRYLQAVSSTIGGGTSEIQRNIIATRGLALPRG